MNFSPKHKFATQFFTLLSIVLLFALLSTVAIIIFQLKGVEQWRMLMAASVIQNIGMFIIPAFITARIFNNGRTIQVLQLNRFPGFIHFILMLLIYIASIPMMNAIIEWNEAIKLPESWAGIEQWLRSQEDAALNATNTMLKLDNIGQLLIAILVMGVLTGVGEEIIFRGSLQRLIREQGINIHLAIWITAFVFSAIHMQFYGFVPRMLLGAFFGYMLIWSGSLWLPIIAHALNNSMAVLSYYNPTINDIFWMSESPSTTMIAISSMITIGLIYIYYRYAQKSTAV